MYSVNELKELLKMKNLKKEIKNIKKR